MKKNKTWIVAWLICVIIFSLLFFKKKEVEKPKQSVQTQTTQNPQTIQNPSNLWIPDHIDFCNRPLFLEGEIKQKLLRELEIEVNRYKQPGVLDSVKNDIWLSDIKKQVIKSGIPLDIIYLPIIESSMMPTITSNKGAGGYWQFMPTTASLYKLEITSYIDERFDPVKSTDKAILHLNDLFDRFEDWTTALGGYNMNPQVLEDAIKQERTSNFYKLKTIPEETQRFPFRLMATKLIFENPEKYGFSRTGWLKDGAYDTWQILEIDLIVESDASIEKIVNEMKADYKDLTLYDFRKFNPQILGDYLPRGNYTVYIIQSQNGTS